MIEEPTFVLLGRLEAASYRRRTSADAGFDAQRWLLDCVDRLTDRAAWILSAQASGDAGPERDSVLATIRAPDAVLLQGRFGAWSVVDFLAWSGFLKDPLPVLAAQVRYRPADTHLSPVVLRPDPPVLLRQHLLVPEDHRPSRDHPRSVGDLRAIARVLEEVGVLADPRATTRPYVVALLQRHGYGVTDRAVARVGLVPEGSSAWNA